MFLGQILRLLNLSDFIYLKVIKIPKDVVYEKTQLALILITVKKYLYSKMLVNRWCEIQQYVSIA